eukprot:g39944.t1
MNGRTLDSLDEQRDLGVIIYRSLKSAEHTNRIVKKAYGTFAVIGLGIDYKCKEVTSYTEEDTASDVVYIDFCKAFDKVPHGRLVQKLRAHGIQDDTKIGGIVYSDRNGLRLQSNIDQLRICAYVRNICHFQQVVNCSDHLKSGILAHAL